MGTRLSDLTTIRLLVQDEGVPIARQPKLNFVGAGVTAAEDSGNDRINVNIPGGPGFGTGHVIEDEGTPLAQQTTMNFVGAGVTATDAGGKTVVTIPGGGGSAYDTIQDEGVAVAQETVIDFVGAGVTATPGTGKTIVTIPGGGGGGLDYENLGRPDLNWWLYDEFLYPTASDIGLHFEHVQSSLSVPSGMVGGVVRQGTSAADNNDTRLNTCGAGQVAIDGTKKVIVRWRAKVTVDNAFTAFICGLTEPGDGPQSPFPYVNRPGPLITFLYEGTGGSSGNIDTYTDDGSPGVNEQTDTGVAMGTGFHTYDIEVNPTVNIIFKIDGNIVKTQTTNLPSANFTVWIGVQNGTTAGRSIDIDSVFIFNER